MIVLPFGDNAISLPMVSLLSSTVILDISMRHIIEAGAKEAGNAEDLKKSQDQALTLKQDIARRQWEKKIPLSKLECYLKGTIEKNAFTK